MRFLFDAYQRTEPPKALGLASRNVGAYSRRE